MFRNKYKIEKKSALELKREDAAAKAADLRDSFVSSAQDAADSAKKNAKQARKDLKKQTKVADKKSTKVAKLAKKTAKAQAKTAAVSAAAPVALAGAAAHVIGERVSEKAQPLVDAAQEKATPVVESARETIMDEIMPRVSEALAGLAASATAAKEVASDKAQPLVERAQPLVDQANERVNERFGDVQGRSSDAYAVLKGDKVAVDKGKQRSGTVLMVLGLIAAGAAAALTAWQQMQPKDDPWSTPLLDPYTPPTAGRESSLTATPAAPAAAGTATFSADREGSDAELSPAEMAQGGPETTVLTPVKDQEYTTQTSTAGQTPDDTGAGGLLNETQSFERDANGNVVGDEQKKTF